MKRNMSQIAGGEILINFDDDDYYFSDRVSMHEKLSSKDNQFMN